VFSAIAVNLKAVRSPGADKEHIPGRFLISILKPARLFGTLKNRSICYCIHHLIQNQHVYLVRSETVPFAIAFTLISETGTSI
jgi:hypothetical protein